MIIYPPFIGDTIPAFTSDKIVIPFSLNPAVSIDEVDSFELIIKDYVSSEIIANLSAAADDTYLKYDSDTKSGEITFFTGSWTPETKQYYKFQMSYSDGTNNPNTGKPYRTYSSASIGRCIGEAPEILINSQDNIEFEGIYTTSIISEPIYSYRFIFYLSDNDKVIQDTKEVLHNVDLDEIKDNKRKTIHLFRLWYDLEDKIEYKLKYIVTTINGYQISIEKNIVKSPENDFTFPLEITATQSNYAIDNGYVTLLIKNTKATEEQIIGNYILQRNEEGQDKWEELATFTITSSEASSFYIEQKDYSVKQGIKYIYSLRKKENLGYSKRIETNSIKVEFEDLFLSDKDKLLKIRFNPKVSSFKDTILELKIDTIGSQYPFIFRNGSVKYKEISLSGLISYLMDENGHFINEEIEEKSILLTNDNIAQERKFKLEVLDWLNNGKAKLFRSPTEGNYIIRVTNVSFNPTDSLGRMLHSFNATGYEIMENTIDNLFENDLICFGEISKLPSSKLGSFLLGYSILGG